MHCEVQVSVHACTNDYLRCTKCEVHDRVRKHIIRCTKKRVPRFLILEALHRCFPVNIAKFLRAPILTNICERLLLNNRNSLSCAKSWKPPIIAQYDAQPRRIKILIVLLLLLIGLKKASTSHNVSSSRNAQGGGGVLLALLPPPPTHETCNVTKSTTLSWVFFTSFKLYNGTKSLKVSHSYVVDIKILSDFSSN